MIPSYFADSLELGLDLENPAWIFVLGGVRLFTERFATYRTHVVLRLPHWRHTGEKRHLVGVGRGLGRSRARGPGLGGSLAKFQGHKEPTSRVAQVIFALTPTGEQVEMLAGVLEVFLNWFRPHAPAR
jgi:hypothetical protein